MEKKPSEAEVRFNAIVEEYGKLLRDVISNLCPKDMGLDFDDIEQEARLKLWRAIKSEREIRNLPSYVYRIAFTTTIDAMRKVQDRREEQMQLIETEEEPVLQIASEEALPDQLAEQQQLIEKVEQALALLPPDRRRVVGLYLGGMTSREIGEILGWSEPKARNLLYRGLKTLRKYLRLAGVECE